MEIYGVSEIRNDAPAQRAVFPIYFFTWRSIRRIDSKDESRIWQQLILLRKEFPDQPELVPFKDMSDDQIVGLVEVMSTGRRQMANKFLVNCWHMSEYESIAMWKIYTAASEAICIQTTFEKLRLLMPEWVNIGCVKYINYDTDVVAERNMFNFVTVKRQSFDYERELRAVIWSIGWHVASTDIRDTITTDGMWVTVPLSELIDRVYISPTSPAWFAECVSSLVETYGLSVPLQQSSLSASPIY